MDSAKNLHVNCKSTGLSGPTVEARAKQYGGFSQKSWSNLTRDGFIVGKTGNIGLDKLDILAKVLDTSPCALISPPGDEGRLVTSEELESSLKKALSVLQEVQVIDDDCYQEFLQVVDLLATAQHAALAERDTNTGTGIISKIVKVLANKAGIGT